MDYIKSTEVLKAQFYIFCPPEALGMYQGRPVC